MSYKVEYVVESDAPELGVINYAAFEHRRLLHRMFPETEPSLLGEYKSKHVMKHLVNPETHVLKVRDPETGKIAAYSRWHFPAQRGITPNIPPLSEQALEYAKDPVAFAPQPMNKEVFDAFKALLQDARKRHAKDEDMGKLICFFLPIQSSIIDSPTSSTRFTSDFARISRPGHWLYGPEMGRGTG